MTDTNERVSAEPDQLIRYADVAGEINSRLENEARLLSAALEQFAATCTAYTTGIGPALAAELSAYVQRIDPTDEWVRQVGEDFAEADAKSVKESGEWLPHASAFLQAQEAAAIGLALARRTHFKKGPRNRMVRSSLKKVVKARKGTLVKAQINSRQLRKLAHVGKRTTFTKYDWRAPIKQRRQIWRLTKSAARRTAAEKWAGC